MFFSIIACAAMITSGCTKAGMITDLPVDINKTTVTPENQTKAKRGVAFSSNTQNWAQRVVNLQSNWYYNWGTDGPNMQGAPVGVEFVPMIWGHPNVTKANIDKINDMYAQGKIFFLLGFNEPDLSAESNMTVAQALEDWKFICDNINPNIKLVSPAPSYPSRQWLVDFMDGCQKQGLRVDYVAVHIYAGIGTSIYETAIRDVYNKFQKPVWITEFAPRDDNAKANGFNSYSSDQILNNFMSVVVPKYESMPEVFRYAWFSPGFGENKPGGQMLGLVTSMLTSNDGLTLTNLGDYYKTISPNSKVRIP